MDSSYETDFIAWTAHQTKLLHQHRAALEAWGIDVTNLAEEVGCLGRSEHRELEDRLLVLLVHLLKWQYQPRRQTHSSHVTIREQRRRLERLLTRNPSLSPILDTAIKEVYQWARDRTVAQTGLREETFAADYSWPPAQVLDVTFLP